MVTPTCQGGPTYNKLLQLYNKLFITNVIRAQRLKWLGYLQRSPKIENNKTGTDGRHCRDGTKWRKPEAVEKNFH